MTDSNQHPTPATDLGTDLGTESGIDPGIAKGIALGLGMLLLGGTALMIVLLLTQKSVPEPGDLPPIALQTGEKIIAVTCMDGQALFVVEDTTGLQKVLLVNLATGARTDVEILAHGQGVTD